MDAVSTLTPTPCCGTEPDETKAALGGAASSTCVGAQVPLEGGVAGEGAVALAADVAAHPCVHLHVLLQGRLRLEALAAEQAEHSHVRTCGRGDSGLRHRPGTPRGRGAAGTPLASLPSNAMHPQTVQGAETHSPRSWEAQSLLQEYWLYHTGWMVLGSQPHSMNEEYKKRAGGFYCFGRRWKPLAVGDSPAPQLPAAPRPQPKRKAAVGVITHLLMCCCMHLWKMELKAPNSQVETGPEETPHV